MPKKAYKIEQKFTDIKLHETNLVNLINRHIHAQKHSMNLVALET